MELHHPIMSKLWDLGGQTKRNKERYQPSKCWPFIYHMCAYFVQITVVKYDAQPSNDVNYFNVFYVVVSMLRGQ